MRLDLTAIAIVGTALLAGPPARAQRPSQPAARTVTGSGVASLPLRPTSLRLEIPLQADGKTAEAALEQLERRKKRAETKLKKIVPGATGLKFSRPEIRLGSSDDDEDDEDDEPVAVEAPADGADDKSAEPVTYATTTLRAECPLPAGPVERMVAAAESLKEKIEAAGLTDTRHPLKAGVTRPDDPFLVIASLSRASLGASEFVYVATISEPDRKEALARAFADAKRDAAEMAEATGARLGPMVKITRSAAEAKSRPSIIANGFLTDDEDDDEDEDEDELGGHRIVRGGAHYRESGSEIARQSEVAAPTADGLKLEIRIDVVYQVVPAGK